MSVESHSNLRWLWYYQGKMPGSNVNKRNPLLLLTWKPFQLDNKSSVPEEAAYHERDKCKDHVLVS